MSVLNRSTIPLTYRFFAVRCDKRFCTVRRSRCTAPLQEETVWSSGHRVPIVDEDCHLGHEGGRLQLNTTYCSWFCREQNPRSKIINSVYIYRCKYKQSVLYNILTWHLLPKPVLIWPKNALMLPPQSSRSSTWNSLLYMIPGKITSRCFLAIFTSICLMRPSSSLYPVMQW